MLDRLRRLAAVIRSTGSRVAERPEIVTIPLAGVLLAITWPTINDSHRITASLLPVLAVMTVAPVLLLRRHAFAAWCLSAAGAVLWVALPQLPTAPMPWPVVHFLVLLATIAASALWARLREVAIVTAASAVLFLLALPPEMKGWSVGAVVVVVFALLVRWLLTSRRELADQVDEVEAQRASRAVLEERGRIARELHDVVAHHMSMVVVQAQSAPYRLPQVSAEVAAEFAAIEGSARAALQEVRGVLGVLREESGRPAVAPQPSLQDLPALLESARSAGIEVDARLEVGAVPPGTGLVLYRIVQETLANASRHAPGAPVTLSLIESGADAELVVRNGPGAPASSVPTPGGGHGIEGMATRAEAVGGTLRAGPTAGGGFLVEARAPLRGRPQDPREAPPATAAAQA